ncbi:MAG: GIY-YIG nuclease family protein [Bacteroidales bacterium]|jgi:putative endonuclease|nr:GIY-YIG nuclease family protein [Bacteroidales bacterium]
MHFVYILYSPKADKFYIGETHDIEKRIIAHNNHVYKKSFTHIANDWELFYKIECKNEQQAKQIEHHLKKMRNRKYYQNLKLYPAITKKLLEQYP